MAIPLSGPTVERIRALFGESDFPRAAELLERECAEGLPLWSDPTPIGLERVRFAALKRSGGDLEELRRQIELAKTDWRDLLVAAGFAEDPNAHYHWRPGSRAPILRAVCRIVARERSLPSSHGLLNLDPGGALSAFVEEICRRHGLKPWARAAFDGFAEPNELEITDSSLTFCGRFHTLGDPAPWQVPARLELSRKAGNLHYELRLGRADPGWERQTESRQWKAVFRMCQGELSEPWTWAAHVRGAFEEGES